MRSMVIFGDPHEIGPSDPWPCLREGDARTSKLVLCPAGFRRNVRFFVSSLIYSHQVLVHDGLDDEIMLSCLEPSYSETHPQARHVTDLPYTAADVFGSSSEFNNEFFNGSVPVNLQ